MTEDQLSFLKVQAPKVAQPLEDFIALVSTIVELWNPRLSILLSWQTGPSCIGLLQYEPRTLFLHSDD